MKYAIWISMLLFSGSLLYAQNTPEDAQSELLSAKVAYQQALSAQSNLQTKYIDSQKRLATAKNRLSAAQQEMQAAQKAYDEIIGTQQQSAQNLQAAGKRLDAAWTAVNH